MLALLLSLQLLPFPVVSEKLDLKCAPVTEEQGRALLVRNPAWADGEHPRLELCGRISLGGTRWGVLVREVGKGMVLDREMVFVVVVSSEGTRLDELPFSGSEDLEGGSGSQRRSGTLAADGRAVMKVSHTMPTEEREVEVWQLSTAGRWELQVERPDGEQPSVSESCLAYDGHYEVAPLMRVRAGIPGGKVNFQKKAEPCAAGCPSREKAYLVPGDVVFAGPELRGHRCAYYGTAKGEIVAGFLPPDALEEAQETGIIDSKFLAGTWVSLGENPITFKAADGNAIHAQGKAVWRGPADAHLGSFSATAVPRGESMTLVDEACEVRVRRRGPYLLVDDNLHCGGVNVRFRGIYVKKAR